MSKNGTQREYFSSFKKIALKFYLDDLVEEVDNLLANEDFYIKAPSTYASELNSLTEKIFEQIRERQDYIEVDEELIHLLKSHIEFVSAKRKERYSKSRNGLLSSVRGFKYTGFFLSILLDLPKTIDEGGKWHFTVLDNINLPRPSSLSVKATTDIIEAKFLEEKLFSYGKAIQEMAEAYYKPILSSLIDISEAYFETTVKLSSNPTLGELRKKFTELWAEDNQKIFNLVSEFICEKSISIRNAFSHKNPEKVYFDTSSNRLVVEDNTYTEEDLRLIFSQLYDRCLNMELAIRYARGDLDDEVKFENSILSKVAKK